MYDIFLRGGTVMWPLLILSILALGLGLHRFSMMHTLQTMPGNAFSKKAHEQRIQHGIDTLYLIASIAPLLGLLGTVFGIISLFSVLASGRPDAQVLTNGLSQALFTTAAGLIIAVPTQIAAHVLQQQLDTYLERYAKKQASESAQDAAPGTPPMTEQGAAPENTPLLPAQEPSVPTASSFPAPAPEFFTLSAESPPDISRAIPIPLDSLNSLTSLNPEDKRTPI